MSRAQRLSPDARREAILDATLPLVLKHGIAVSTKQIAEASGIAEGTIFRVFDSKAELLEEVVRRGLRPGTVVARLDALAAAPDLRGHVAAIVGVLQSHSRQTHRLMNLVPPAELGRHRGHSAPDDHRAIGEQTIAAIERALAPHADALGVAPRTAAGAVLALSFGSTLASDPPPAPEAVADLLLHGIAGPDARPSPGHAPLHPTAPHEGA